MIASPLLALFRMADGSNHISRRTYVILCLWVTFTSTLSVADTAAWMWVLCVLTMLPTNALMSAVHGVPPSRNDGRWQWLQDATWMVIIMGRREGSISTYWFAIIYGAIRSLLIIPAVIWLQEPWLMLAMLQGVVYFICGKLSKKQPVRWAEGISGAFIGAMM